MSQLDTTLRALRERGDRGVHTHELRSGLFGECIANPSERIARLEKLGYSIAVSEKVPLHGKALGVRYTLVVDAEQASDASEVTRLSSPGPAPAEHLFGADEYRRGHWDEAA